MEQVKVKITMEGPEGRAQTEVVGVKLGDHTLVNLTPHEVVVEGNGEVIRIPPSGALARVTMGRKGVERTLMGMPFLTIGPIVTYPLPQEGVIYIVSSLMAQALKGRRDVVAPDTDRARRDEKGQIVSVPGFVRYGD
ncbi:MAG: hypothetical protein N2557_08595, partial [Hydrogenophilus sp.]|nr:hypothetical protein [Hydrogenophilus sp.]